MPAVTRAGDRVISPDGSGKKCRFPMRTSVGQVNSVNVFVNKILVPITGNLVSPHNKGGCIPDTSTLSGSSKVFVGGQGIGRIGDKYGDNIVTKGSSNVFAG